MCGSFVQNRKKPKLKKIIEQISPEQGSLLELLTDDIRPTNFATVLLPEGEFFSSRIMTWGFPKKDGKGVIFNARAETALDKPMFSNALLHRPVVVPVTGFYEWLAVPGQKLKDKYFFTVQNSGLCESCEPCELRDPCEFRDPCDLDDELLYLAGFFSVFAGNENAVPGHFTILTTAANNSMAPYHARMPIILGETEIIEWLRGERLNQFLTREPAAVIAERVC